MRRRLIHWLLSVCVLVSVSGCRFSVGMLRAMLGDSTQPSMFENRLGVDLTEGNKKLLILCSASHSVTSEEASLPIDILSGISKRLRQQGVDVVDPDEVANWLDENGSWDDLTSLGNQFEADYIAVINLRNIAYKEPRSSNLMRAHAAGEIRIYEMDDIGNGESEAAQRYGSAINEKYPATYPIQANALSESMFRRNALDYLCQTLARHFHDYHPRETITH